jgi:hypothetical protein
VKDLHDTYGRQVEQLRDELSHARDQTPAKGRTPRQGSTREVESPAGDN